MGLITFVSSPQDVRQNLAAGRRVTNAEYLCDLWCVCVPRSRLGDADSGLAFTILGVYSVWSPDWKPLLVVIPLTLVKPAVGIVRVFTGTTQTDEPLM